MTINQTEKDLLLERIESLARKQEQFSREIGQLREDITNLSAEENTVNQNVTRDPEVIKIDSRQDFLDTQDTQKIAEPSSAKPAGSPAGEPNFYKPSQRPVINGKKEPKISLNLEKFIGENLINKIGIAITIIGVAIGVKYSIDHELISPLTRVLLGYLFGFILLGVGYSLKKKYESYGAVLVSGAMAIIYFITYFAYSFYALLPQTVAFTVMACMTVFTVLAALNFDKQVIAHIGLVGAYAVPFLLSDGSGQVFVLFSYMAVINTGILVISYYKYWKQLSYASFLLTWLIYFSWFNSKFDPTIHVQQALLFLSIFFALFYFTFLVYKLRRSEKFEAIDVSLLLANTFLFFGIGYAILDSTELLKDFRGLFTLTNSAVHLMVCLIIFQQKVADKELRNLIAGLALLFLTIAFPVQLDGSWVTLLWAGEALLLFYIGRTKASAIYEVLAYPVIILAFFSLLQDWSVAYNFQDPEHPIPSMIPLWNITFLTSLLVSLSFSYINLLNISNKYTIPEVCKREPLHLMTYILPGMLLFTLYVTFRNEIAVYWDQLYLQSHLSIKTDGGQFVKILNNTDLIKFRTIWIINYSLLFFTLLSFANIHFLKNRLLGFINLIINTLILFLFLVESLYLFGELKESLSDEIMVQNYHPGSYHEAIRYISFAFAGLILSAGYRYIKQDFLKDNFRKVYDILLFGTLLWILSSEFIYQTNSIKSDESYKLGLSILWGIYSLMLISLGIWKKKKHLRIGAIVLFGVTLIKLFFYDISHLNTISKTIVFVLLGILLLIISFLYNKFTHLISEDVPD